MAVPYTFGSATSSIPLSQLDSNFATTITLGNTAIQLGNTVTTLNNMTLANVTVMTVSGASANAVVYTNSTGQVTANSSVIALDTSGNLGLGVTPSAWVSSAKAIEMPYGAFAVESNGYPSVLNNAYEYSVGAFKYRYSGLGASRYIQTFGSHGWSVAGSGTAGNAITWTAAMTLDASGNLGVGTTSPSYRVHAALPSSTSGVVARFSAPSYENFDIYVGSTKVSIGSASGATPLCFNVNNSEVGRFDSSGNLLVGTTNPASNAGNGLKVTNVGGVYAVGTTGDTYNFYNSTASAYRFYVTSAGVINATSTTITAISDQRLKENVQDIDVGLNAVLALKPRKFDWKAGKGKDKKGDRGWIAQEFEQVFPDMITTWKDAPPEGEEPYKAVNADLIPVLVKAIQEQQAIITQLQADVAALKGTK